jgi:hypothetical protein
MVRWLIILVLLGGTLPTAHASAPSEPNNYCHSPESWAEWDQLLAQHPHDRGLQTLHALRLGICLKVDRGEITLDDGTTINAGKNRPKAPKFVHTASRVWAVLSGVRRFSGAGRRLGTNIGLARANNERARSSATVGDIDYSPILRIRWSTSGNKAIGST